MGIKKGTKALAIAAYKIMLDPTLVRDIKKDIKKILQIRAREKTYNQDHFIELLRRKNVEPFNEDNPSF